jgi:surfactin family lipopeptide synthetase C
LTTSGKIDRKALPAPPKTRPHLENAFIEARTPVEETLVRIWSKVLGIDQVGIHDNFFELGGNSLMGTRVVSHIRDTFFLDLPVRLIFENPTVAEVAVVITQRKAADEGQKDIDQILAQLETLSDEEAQELLNRKNRTLR